MIKCPAPWVRSLRYVGLQPKTQRAYRLALASFLKYIKKSKICCRNHRKLDAAVADYISTSYQKADPIAYSGHLLSALKRFHPELRLKLPNSSQLYRNWTRAYAPKRAVPASWELVEALIAKAMANQMPKLGLLLGVAFHCMLRTSELLSLTHGHIMVHDSQQAMSVVLPTSKTSEGNPQVLQVEDPVLISMAKELLRRKRKQQLIWTRSTGSFRQTFQDLLQGLGFQPQSYFPDSLRRGGATWYYQRTLSLDATVMRGRWSCRKTARIYIDSGTLQLTHLTWSGK